MVYYVIDLPLSEFTGLLFNTAFTAFWVPRQECNGENLLFIIGVICQF